VLLFCISDPHLCGKAAAEKEGVHPILFRQRQPTITKYYEKIHMNIVLKTNTALCMVAAALEHHNHFTRHSPAKKMLSSCSFLSNSVLQKNPANYAGFLIFCILFVNNGLNISFLRLHCY